MPTPHRTRSSAPARPRATSSSTTSSVTGTISPAAPTTGQQFNVTGSRSRAVPRLGGRRRPRPPGSPLSPAPYRPRSTPPERRRRRSRQEAMAFDIPIPNPIPSSGMTLRRPVDAGHGRAVHGDEQQHHRERWTRGRTPPTSTETASAVIDLNCSSYPNDTPAVGLHRTTPRRGCRFSPVIATAGQRHPAAGALRRSPDPTSCTAPTPRWVTSCSTTSSPPPRSHRQSLSAGRAVQRDGLSDLHSAPRRARLRRRRPRQQRFQRSGHQCGRRLRRHDRPGLDRVDGLRRAHPGPVPTSGLGRRLPHVPTTVGPFTAVGRARSPSPRTSPRWWWRHCRARRSRCRARPTPTTALPTSGSTGTAPSGPPIRPVIAIGSASGTIPDDHAPCRRPATQPTSPTGPYELYCPGSPVGQHRAQRHGHLGHDLALDADPGPAVPAVGPADPVLDPAGRGRAGRSASGSPRSAGTRRCSSTPRASLSSAGSVDVVGSSAR